MKTMINEAFVRRNLRILKIKIQTKPDTDKKIVCLDHIH